MIYLYTGTPGSGKSLHVAKDIYTRLMYNRKCPNVICNFAINKKIANKGNFIYKDNINLTVQYLVRYALKYHKMGVENQTLVVVDEAQVIWNSRNWMSHSERMDWIKFFSQHRKFGFNIVLIVQYDRMLDRQIRAMVEYEVKHRKINNYKIGWIVPFPLFIAVNYWYGLNEKIGSELFIYRSKWGKFYDSYGSFEIDEKLMNLAK